MYGGKRQKQQQQQQQQGRSKVKVSHHHFERRTVHHLIPRQVKDKMIAEGKFTTYECNDFLAVMCSLCHAITHNQFSNEELARHLWNTKDLKAALAENQWFRRVCLSVVSRCAVLVLALDARAPSHNHSKRPKPGTYTNVRRGACRRWLCRRLIYHTWRDPN